MVTPILNSIPTALHDLAMKRLVRWSNKSVKLSFEQEKDGIRYILGLVSNTVRFQLFLDLQSLLTDKGYWHGLAYAYTMSDELDRFSNEIFKSVFTARRNHREFLMSDSEREYLKSLPEKITVYSAMPIEDTKTKNYGPSWSLKKEVADFFSTKYSRFHNKTPMIVHSITVKRDDVIAYFQERHEFEVIYF